MKNNLLGEKRQLHDTKRFSLVGVRSMGGTVRSRSRLQLGLGARAEMCEV